MPFFLRLRRGFRGRVLRLLGLILFLTLLVLGLVLARLVLVLILLLRILLLGLRLRLWRKLPERELQVVLGVRVVGLIRSASLYASTASSYWFI